MTRRSSIERLTLVDIRSYERLTLDLAAGITVLVGPNGIGKTNVLEACAVALTGSSPRTSTEQRLIRNGASEGRVAARVRVDDAVHARDVTYRSGAGKQLRLDGSPARTVEAYAATAACVTFLPERLLIVRGAPQRRRAMIDQLAMRLLPDASATQRSYAHALQQRNALLRRARGGARVEDQLAPWSQQLVSLGTDYRRQRQAVLELLERPMRDRFEQLTGLPGAVFTTEVRGSGDLERDLADVAALEPRRGTTLIGPHLDDLLPMQAERNLRAFGSAGEQRAVLLAYCLAARDVMSELAGVEPVLLLDEPWSELDADRRRRLSEVLADCTQVVVTSTEPPRHLERLDAAIACFEVSFGAVNPWGPTTTSRA